MRLKLTFRIKARGKPFKHIIQHTIQHVIYKMLERFAHCITLLHNLL